MSDSASNRLQHLRDVLDVQKLENIASNPELLKEELAKRFDNPMEAFQPINPFKGEEDVESETPSDDSWIDHQSYLYQKRKLCLLKATPHKQFKSQVKRESERLDHQVRNKANGRRGTLLWNELYDTTVNAENNVATRWMKQGIWAREWGPLWPPNNPPSITRWREKDTGGSPFTGHGGNETLEWKLAARWGHEYVQDQGVPVPESETVPEPALEIKSEPAAAKVKTEPASEPAVETKSEPASQPATQVKPEPASEPAAAAAEVKSEPAASEPEPEPYINLGAALRESPPSAGIRKKLPADHTVWSPTSSRPYDQFMAQYKLEYAWLRDELQFQGIVKSDLQVKKEAAKILKDIWIHDGIWDPKWTGLPGRRWMYEDLEDEEAVAEAQARNEPPVAAPREQRVQRLLGVAPRYTLAATPPNDPDSSVLGVPRRPREAYNRTSNTANTAANNANVGKRLRSTGAGVKKNAKKATAPSQPLRRSTRPAALAALSKISALKENTLKDIEE